MCVSGGVSVGVPLCISDYLGTVGFSIGWLAQVLERGERVRARCSEIIQETSVGEILNA